MPDPVRHDQSAWVAGMEDLIEEFVTGTAEHLEAVDIQPVRFEQDPSDRQVLDNVFHLMRTIKGTCGFPGLPRLETVAANGSFPAFR